MKYKRFLVVAVFIVALVLIFFTKGEDKKDKLELPFDISIYNESVSIDGLKFTEDFTEEDIINLNGGNDVVIRDENGVVKNINGVFSTQKVFSPEEAVQALASVRTLCEINRFEFEVLFYERAWAFARTATDISQGKYIFYQLHKGVKVHNSRIDLYVNPETGETAYLAIEYTSGISLEDVEPVLTYDEAISKLPKLETRLIVEPKFRNPFEPKIHRVELTIYQNKLCWSLWGSWVDSASGSGSYTYILDSTYGKELDYFDDFFGTLHT